MTTAATDLASTGERDTISQLRRTAGEQLAGKLITVASGKGGVGKTTLAIELAYLLGAVLVDLDWDDGCASRGLGWRHEDRVRSPLLDALDRDRAPRPLKGGASKPDLVPAGPDLEANQPEAELMADSLLKWAREWDRPVVVDTHPGGSLASFGAMSGAHLVPTPILLGERELDALAGWCAELDGYPLLIAPNRIPRIAPTAQLRRLAGIARGHELPVATPIPDAPAYLPRRKARTAVCSASRPSARSAPVIDACTAVANEVIEHA